MKEIERKFLIDGTRWKPKGKGILFKQGYLSVDPERTIRVRIADKQAFLTIKGKTKGISRTELEYPIPVNEAETLFSMCLKTPVEKIRHYEEHNGMMWEIDVFRGKNSGLLLAEVELKSEDQAIELPSWVLEEVSGDLRYYNSWLSQNPFTDWE